MRRGFGWGAAILYPAPRGRRDRRLQLGAERGARAERQRRGGSLRRRSRLRVLPVFPFLPIPLFFLALFAFKGSGWRRHWDHEQGGRPGGHGPHGRWEQGHEWHRRRHEVGGGSGTSGAGGEPA